MAAVHGRANGALAGRSLHNALSHVIAALVQRHGDSLHNLACSVDVVIVRNPIVYN